MAVKPGYKQTAVGVIPEEWHVEAIGKLIDERFIIGHLDGNHGELYPRNHEFKSHGVPYIGANDFEEGSVTFARCKFLTPERAKQFRKGVAKDGDVLFAHNATVGPVALLRTNEPFVILSTTATYFRCDLDKLDNSYLKAALESLPFIRQYQAVMAQSTRFQVPITAQRKLLLVVPPPREQRVIAQALSDVNDLLAGLDRLIAKKRNLKQAAMQQLLTGRTRLPGFTGDWEGKTLGEVATFLKGKGLPKTAISSDGIQRCIHYGELFTKYSEVIGETFSRTNETLGCVRSMTNDVLMPTSDVTPRGLAKASCVLLDGIILGGDILVIRSDRSRVFGTFLAYVIRREENQVLQVVTGSTVYHLYGSAMKEFTFSLPSVPEQIAITDILLDMDAELAALEQRREKTRELKQAMMQELLTGKTRLR